MKNLSLTLALLALALFFGTAHAFPPQSELNSLPGKTQELPAVTELPGHPWRIIVTNENGDTTSTIYFDRDGKRISAMRPGYKVAYSLPSDNKDYYERVVTRKAGNIDTVRTYYLYGEGYGTKKDTRPYTLYDKYIDRHGNWTVAYDKWRSKGFQRFIPYFDDPESSAEEDAAVRDWIVFIKKYVDRKENPFAFENLAGGVFSIAAKLLFVFTLAMLFMLFFKRDRLYAYINRKAGAYITPRGIFSPLQLSGLVPALLILGPVSLHVLNSPTHSTAVMPDSVIWQTAATTILAVIYCIAYTVIRGASVGRRQARAEVLYGLVSCLCVWGALLLGVMVAVALIAVLFFAGMLFGKGGSASGGTSPSGNCRNCGNCCHRKWNGCELGNGITSLDSVCDAHDY